MKVRDIIVLSECAKSKVFNQLGEEFYITRDNYNEIYEKQIEHIKAEDGVIYIYFR